MTSRPSTSDSKSTDLSATQASNSGYSDQSRLSKLYPEPKTYEQRKADSEQRQQMYRSRLSKHPHLGIASYGSAVFALITWLMQNLDIWWLGSGDLGLAMSRVFFSFFVVLVLLFLLVAWVSYANKQLYDFQGAPRLFWIVYSVLLAALLVLALSNPLGEHANGAWLLILTALHFVALYVSARRILHRT